jgi:hypothetical protein
MTTAELCAQGLTAGECHGLELLTLAHRWLPPDAPPYAWARRYLFRMNAERSLPLEWKRASIVQDHVG